MSNQLPFFLVKIMKSAKDGNLDKLINFITSYILVIFM